MTGDVAGAPTERPTPDLDLVEYVVVALPELSSTVQPFVVIVPGGGFLPKAGRADPPFTVSKRFAVIDSRDLRSVMSLVLSEMTDLLHRSCHGASQTEGRDL